MKRKYLIILLSIFLISFFTEKIQAQEKLKINKITYMTYDDKTGDYRKIGTKNIKSIFWLDLENNLFKQYCMDKYEVYLIKDSAIKNDDIIFELKSTKNHKKYIAIIRSHSREVLIMQKTDAFLYH